MTQYADIEDLLHLIREKMRKDDSCISAVRARIRVYTQKWSVTGPQVYVMNYDEEKKYVTILLSKAEPKSRTAALNSAVSGREILKADKQQVLRSLFCAEEDWESVKSVMEETTYLFLSIAISINLAANCPTEIEEELVRALEEAVSEEEKENRARNKIYFEAEPSTQKLAEIPPQDWLCFLSEDGKKFILDKEAEARLFHVEINVIGFGYKNKKEKEEEYAQRMRLRKRMKEHLDKGGLVCLAPTK